jgi:hypothetical protein
LLPNWARFLWFCILTSCHDFQSSFMFTSGRCNSLSTHGLEATYKFSSVSSSAVNERLGNYNIPNYISRNPSFYDGCVSGTWESLMWQWNLGNEFSVQFGIHHLDAGVSFKASLPGKTSVGCVCVCVCGCVCVCSRITRSAQYFQTHFPMSFQHHYVSLDLVLTLMCTVSANP